MLQTKLSKKDLILSSAIQIFCDNGFDRTTINEVAKKAGIGKSTVYEYFKSKDELFIECIRAMIKHYNNGFNDILDKDISFKEKLYAILEHTENLFLQAAIGLSMLHKNPPKEIFDMQDIINSERTYINSCLQKSILKAMENGELRSDISVQVLSTYIQMSTTSMIFSSSVQECSSTSIDSIVTLIWGGIGK